MHGIEPPGLTASFSIDDIVFPYAETLALFSMILIIYRLDKIPYGMISGS